MAQYATAYRKVGVNKKYIDYCTRQKKNIFNCRTRSISHIFLRMDQTKSSQAIPCTVQLHPGVILTVLLRMIIQQ